MLFYFFPKVKIFGQKTFNAARAAPAKPKQPASIFLMLPPYSHPLTSLTIITSTLLRPEGLRRVNKNDRAAAASRKKHSVGKAFQVEGIPPSP